MVDYYHYQPFLEYQISVWIRVFRDCESFTSVWFDDAEYVHEHHLYYC